MNGTKLSRFCMIPTAAKFSPNKSYVVDRQMINTLNLVPFMGVLTLYLVIQPV